MRMWENTDQNNSESGHFSRSVVKMRKLAKLGYFKMLKVKPHLPSLTKNISRLFYGFRWCHKNILLKKSEQIVPSNYSPYGQNLFINPVYNWLNSD